MWSGSLGVYATTAKNVYIWGVVDQLVQSNVRLNLEGETGFQNPGIVYVTMNGVGDLTVYHGNVFLGRIRGHEVVTKENDALRAATVYVRALQHLQRPAEAIRIVLGLDASQEWALLDRWINTVYRLCIGLRRYGTGGTLLISPSPRFDELDVGYKFNYRRLGDAVILNVLDREYDAVCTHRLHDERADGLVPYDTALELRFAETDAEDRESELTAAVKVVTSLASIDGLVLLSPLLHVHGFGVKVKTGRSVGTVYDGAGFEKRGVRAKKIDPNRFGTRHNSVLRYCRADKDAIGVVISQDGNVRIILSVHRSLVMWDNVKLLRYTSFSKQAALSARTWMKRRSDRKGTTTLGYTDTPKTVDALLRVLNG